MSDEHSVTRRVVSHRFSCACHPTPPSPPKHKPVTSRTLESVFGDKWTSYGNEHDLDPYWVKLRIKKDEKEVLLEFWRWCALLLLADPPVLPFADVLVLSGIWNGAGAPVEDAVFVSF